MLIIAPASTIASPNKPNPSPRDVITLTPVAPVLSKALFVSVCGISIELAFTELILLKSMVSILLIFWILLDALEKEELLIPWFKFIFWKFVFTFIFSIFASLFIILLFLVYIFT